nr:hypothetical protein [Tanacetum cinerariifolium]
MSYLSEYEEIDGGYVAFGEDPKGGKITVRTQQEEIKELWAAHRKLHAQFIRALTTLKSCQTQLTAALGRIQISEAARVPSQPYVLEEVKRIENEAKTVIFG